MPPAKSQEFEFMDVYGKIESVARRSTNDGRHFAVVNIDPVGEFSLWDDTLIMAAESSQGEFIVGVARCRKGSSKWTLTSITPSDGSQPPTPRATPPAHGQDKSHEEMMMREKALAFAVAVVCHSESSGSKPIDLANQCTDAARVFELYILGMDSPSTPS